MHLSLEVHGISVTFTRLRHWESQGCESQILCQVTFTGALRVCFIPTGQKFEIKAWEVNVCMERKTCIIFKILTTFIELKRALFHVIIPGMIATLKKGYFFIKNNGITFVFLINSSIFHICVLQSYLL